MTSEAVWRLKQQKTKVTNHIPKFENEKCKCLRGIMVRASDFRSKGPGFNSRLRQGKLFSSFILISRKIYNHRPICHGPSRRRRSMGPLPSSFPRPTKDSDEIIIYFTTLQLVVTKYEAERQILNFTTAVARRVRQIELCCEYKL